MHIIHINISVGYQINIPGYSYCLQLLLYHFLQLSNLTGGKHWCGLALEMDPENADVLCDIAELYISQQMYEEAIEDYQTANKIENHPNKVCTGRYIVDYMTFLVC